MAVISKTSLMVEKAKRISRSDKYNRVELKGDFPQQDAFINDTSRYIAAQCSRRAGKTNGLAIRFLRTMEKHPKSTSVYLSLTHTSAKEIMWPVMVEMNDRYNLNLEFTESKLEVKHPNGAKLKLMGADLKNFTKRLKGRKHPAIGIDESQDFGVHLQSLIDDVVGACISDYADGWLAVTGTPGPVPQGYFFDVTQEGKFGYSVHKWTLLDNPHMPNPEAFIADLIKKREWTEENPTLRREYRNQWVLDTNSLWIRYNEKVNDYKELPIQHKWNYILGVDIGFKDADAIAVVAWSETTPEVYLVEELLKRGQGVSALMNQIDALQKKYDAYKIVMDEGGLGKKAAEDYRSRFAVPLEAADKAKKQTNVELLNDYLRLGNFKASKSSQFALDSYLVQIDYEKTTPNRIVIKKNYHSDIIDAVLYAFRESYGHTFKPAEPPKPKWGSPEWLEAQHDEMWEAELEGHRKEQEYNKWLKGE